MPAAESHGAARLGHPGYRASCGRAWPGVVNIPDIYPSPPGGGSPSTALLDRALQSMPNAKRGIGHIVHVQVSDRPAFEINVVDRDSTKLPVGDLRTMCACTSLPPGHLDEKVHAGVHTVGHGHEDADAVGSRHLHGLALIRPRRAGDEELLRCRLS